VCSSFSCMFQFNLGSCRGRDHMIVGFTSTCAIIISAYHPVCLDIIKGPLWSLSYSSWIYNYLWNQCLSPLKLWVRIPLMARYTRYNVMWYCLAVTCDSQWFFTGTPLSSSNKTELYDIAEILLKVALNTNNLNLSLNLISLNLSTIMSTPLYHCNASTRGLMIIKLMSMSLYLN
jgi:hypothetical protein